MEIGSFLELDLSISGEWYSEEKNIARLNSARAGIFHALRVLNCSTIYIPFYLCPSVATFLKKKNVHIQQYYISTEFEPILDHVGDDAAVLLVNYFGILANDFLAGWSRKFKHVIIDNCPAFFNPPIEGCYNVYSTRKFFGVPDGCYVIGKDAEKYTDEYNTDYSSDTSLFLLKRHEVGSSASYNERMLNEERIDNSDILNMSLLTRKLLSAIDYQRIKTKRILNFRRSCELYQGINLIQPEAFINAESIPMVYPLVVEEKHLVDQLREKQIYTGRWWNNVLRQVDANTFEAWLSNYMLPLPIDQRYGEIEINHVSETIKNHLQRID